MRDLNFKRLQQSLLNVVLLFGLNAGISLAALPQLDGYDAHSLTGCPGANFLGDLVAYGVDRCKAICDSFAQCEGFEYMRYSKARNCWPKINCNETSYHGFWHVYVRNPGGGGCTFDETPGYALYGSSDVDLADATPNACKRKCLLDTKCLSFDLNAKTNICSLSYNSKDTKPSFYGQHQSVTYYHKRCGPDVGDVPNDVINAPELHRLVMKDGHCTKVAGPIGEPVGHVTFSDAHLATDNITAIKTVSSGGRYLVRIGLKYGRKWVVLHGKKERRPEVSKVLLRPDEYIMKIKGVYQARIERISFITNYREIGPFGVYVQWDSKPFSVDGGGKPLLYISGSSDSGVAHLNFHFKC